jgi:hypothetical protein
MKNICTESLGSEKKTGKSAFKLDLALGQGALEQIFRMLGHNKWLWTRKSRHHGAHRAAKSK